jgi:type II secretory pathway predicted ATPase ExeA
MVQKNDKKLSIEASRKALRTELKKNCKGKIITKVIHFTNDDVPKYLKLLEQVESESRKAVIMVG